MFFIYRQYQTRATDYPLRFQTCPLIRKGPLGRSCVGAGPARCSPAPSLVQTSPDSYAKLCSPSPAATSPTGVPMPASCPPLGGPGVSSLTHVSHRETRKRAKAKNPSLESTSPVDRPRAVLASDRVLCGNGTAGLSPSLAPVPSSLRRGPDAAPCAPWSGPHPLCAELFLCGFVGGFPRRIGHAVEHIPFIIRRLVVP